MKKYAYATLEYKTGFATYTPEHNPREVIEDYAKAGYRYVGYVPLKIGSYGVIKEIEMVFEKDED